MRRSGLAVAVVLVGLTLGQGCRTGGTRPSGPEAAESAPECAPGLQLTVDLAAWEAELVAAAESPEAVSTVLARLGLRGIPGEDLCLSSPDEERPAQRLSLGGVSVTPAALTGPEPTDRIVEALLNGCPGGDPMEARTFQRIVVLRPLGPGRWCWLGDLSSDQYVTESPNLPDPVAASTEPETLPGRTYALVNLTDPRRQTLRVRDRSGGGVSIERGALYATSYWDVQDSALAEIFRVATYTAYYESPIPPLREEVATVEPTGAFPKDLVVTREVLCHPEEAAEGEPPEPCTPSRAVETYTFRDGRYEAR